MFCVGNCHRGTQHLQLGRMSLYSADGALRAADGVSDIFSNVEQLLVFNSKLLQNLSADYKNQKFIGATFKEAGNLLETYSIYVKNYPKAMKRWATHVIRMPYSL